MKCLNCNEDIIGMEKAIEHYNLTGHREFLYDYFTFGEPIRIIVGSESTDKSKTRSQSGIQAISISQLREKVDKGKDGLKIKIDFTLIAYVIILILLVLWLMTN